LKIEFLEIYEKKEILLDKEVVVYDFEVEEDHSYNIDGIIVHNSQCSTRLKTGVGYPQLSAAIENSDCCHGLGAFLCLDGGMRSPGDVAKAFCANADFVMLGGMFAGTDECEGEIIKKLESTGEYKCVLDSSKDYEAKYEPIIEAKKYKKFYGLSSLYAQELHFGGVKDYRTSEGREGLVEYKGPVDSVVTDILGGLRSACTYIGANSIKNMGKCGSFVKVNRIHDKF
jgi:GMP reductase